MTTLSEFISQVKTGALAKSNRYLISFRLPKILNDKVQNDNENLRKMFMFCSGTQLPGVNISTFQSRTYGEVREIPYEKLFDNVNLTFYVDKDMYIKRFFDAWVNGIQNQTNRTFSFYNDYVSELMINVLDVTDRTTYTVKLYEAYPKSISPIQIGYDQNDVMKMEVSMNYKYWESERMGTAPVLSSSGNGFSAEFDPFTSLLSEINLPEGFDVFDSPISSLNDYLTSSLGVGSFSDWIG